MNMKRAISVLLTVILITAIFIPTGLAEGEGVQLGAESAVQAEQPGEQPSESPSESFGNQSNEEISYFSVEFRDWDGTSLGDVQTVAQGSDAAAPAHPVRDGYEPDGWDKPFTSVQSDLVVTAQYKLVQNADMPDAAMMSMPLSVEPMAADNNVTVYIYIYLGNKEDNLLVYYKITDITADELEALQNKRPKLKGPDLLEALDNLTSEDLSRYVLTPDKYTKDSFEVENTSESGVYKVLVHLKSNIDTENTHDIIFRVDGVEYDRIEGVPFGADLTGYLIAEPTKTGQTFSGWSALPATMPDEDVTVIGSFTVNTYTVRFFAADGVTQIGAAQTVAWGGAAAPVTPPTRTGFTFDTWRLTGDDDTVATSLS
ncbi:MAG: hypothetical protein GXW96_09040, partial [Christensenellaceae bacterium]|nr:hypothetical protein [Christensenellaceae bacterium]